MLRLAFLLALACTMITGCNTPALSRCAIPVQLGTIIYSCDDGMTYRCTDFSGNPKFAGEPCIYDNGKDPAIVCAETCGDASK